MVRPQNKQKPKLMLAQQAPGPLPGTPILWECWKTEWVDEKMQERRRFGAPRVIERPVRSAIEAKHQACVEFWPNWDPQSIDVECILPELAASPAGSREAIPPLRGAKPDNRPRCACCLRRWSPGASDDARAELCPECEAGEDEQPEPEALRPTNLVTGFQASPRYVPDEPQGPRARYAKAIREAVHRFASAMAKHTNGAGK